MAQSTEKRPEAWLERVEAEGHALVDATIDLPPMTILRRDQSTFATDDAGPTILQTASLVWTPDGWRLEVLVELGKDIG